MNFLKPVEISERYIKQIEKAISRYFYVTCFSEIFAIIDSRNFTISNSVNDLINAIQSGKVYYQDGAFRAERFSNLVSKELEKLGATFKKGAYYIDNKQLPPSIISAIDLEKVKAQNKLTSINQFLTNLEIIDITPFVKQIVEKTFEKFTRDLAQTLKDKNIPIIELPYQNPKVEIPVEETKRISDYWTEKEAEANKLREAYEQAKTELENAPDKRLARQKVKIAQETLKNFQKQKYKNAPKFDYTWGGGDMSAQVAENYTYNLKYWVKNWQVDNIIKMRKDVAEMVKRGARIAEVKEYFIKQWHISENKAQFLARNEIGLASTAIKKYQYTQAGCTHFKWLASTVKEKDRRKLHEKYYNKIFEFDNPPLIDERLDIYGLPKQIWNCSCGIMPVVPKAEVKNDRSIFKRYKTRNIEYRRFTERKEV